MAKLRKLVYSVAIFALVLGSFLAYTPNIAKAATPAYDYQLVNQSAYPSTLAPGATTNVWIEVKNTGTATWQSNVRLGSGSAYGAANQQRDYSSEFANSDWPSANRAAGMTDGTRAVSGIRPGWHVRFQFNIKAPMTNGTYKAYFTPVADGVTWMKDIGIYWQITVSDGTTPVTPPVGASGVTLASDTPAAQTVLKGATGVPYMKFNVNMSSAITEIVVKRVGVGASSDFSNVYLYDGATRLTTGRSVSSDTNTATFYGLNISGAKTLTLKAEISTTAGTSNQSAFQVLSVNGTALSNTVQGNTMTIGSQNIAAATIAESSAGWTATLGQVGAEIGKFTIDASAASVINNLSLNSITLRNGGSLSSSNIANLKLKTGSTELATASMSGDSAVFVLSTPYTVTKGQIKTFSIYGDITGGRSGDKISFYVDYNTDVNLTDSVYGFGVQLTNNWPYDQDGDGTADQVITMQGGTVTLAFNGPAVTTLAKNTTQNLFTDISVTSDRNITIKKAKVKMEIKNVAAYEALAATDNYDYLKNIRIVDLATGNTVAGPLSTAGSGTCVEVVDNGGSGGVCEITDTVYFTYEFTDQFDIAVGASKRLGIKADLDNAFTTANRTIALTLDLSGSQYVYDVGSGQYLASTSVVPNTISGNWMSVGADSLRVAVSSSPAASSTAVRRASDVLSMGYLFKSGTTNSSKVTKLVFTGYGDLNGAASYSVGELDDIITSVNLWVDGSKVAGPVSVGTDGKMTFNSLAINIAAGATARIEVTANIASTAGDSTTPPNTRYGIGINSVDDITVENASGNSFAPVADDDGGAFTANEKNYTNATTNPGKTIYVTSSGVLTSSKDAGSPTNAIIVAGTAGSETTKIKFKADYEAFTISKLKLFIDADNSFDAGEAGATEKDSTSDGSIDSITITAGSDSYTGYVSAGAVSFTGLNINVPKDSTTVITAKINYKTVAAGAASGDLVELVYDASDGFEAVGVGSGYTVTSSDGTGGAGAGDVATGGIFTVRKTVPTVTLASDSPAGAGIPGLGNVLKFTVAANAGGDVTLDIITFAMTSSDAASSAWNTGANTTTSDFSLFDSIDMNTSLDTADGNWSLFKADGTAAGAGDVVAFAKLTLPTSVVIPAGQSKTFVLKVDTTGASANPDDSVRFDVAAENAIAGNEFQWDDSDTTATNLSGTNVKNLTVFGNTITY
uniref:Next to BRCA1 central domain-containing protein n=1 Tax=candidate division CPR3 bacterium TaxID=2268181 RepID=A0A7C4R2T3_UNCC3